MTSARPKLRPIHANLIEHKGRPAIMLRDPLQLGPHVMALPQELGPLLALCDGTRDAEALRASLLMLAGLRLSAATLEAILSQLDENLLLDNERSAQAKAVAVATYRALPHRAPASAGASYPADPAALRTMLDEYMAAISNADADADNAGLPSRLPKSLRLRKSVDRPASIISPRPEDALVEQDQHDVDDQN
jgi:hypothetical protein